LDVDDRAVATLLDTHAQIFQFFIHLTVQRKYGQALPGALP
jgi:hypothetical protein